MAGSAPPPLLPAHHRAACHLPRAHVCACPSLSSRCARTRFTTSCHHATMRASGQALTTLMRERYRLYGLLWMAWACVRHPLGVRVPVGRAWALQRTGVPIAWQRGLPPQRCT